MQEFDVVIVGAGPAGTTCALGLFDAGLRVALIDKNTFPREKTCGDAFGSYASNILRTISPAFESRLKNLTRGVVSTAARIFSVKGHSALVNLNGFFMNLPRAEFDNFLLTIVKEETNTAVFENTCVKNLMIEKEGVLLTASDGRKFKSKIVIGCDGAHSIVQTALTGTRESITEISPALRAYYKNVKGMSDHLEIHLLKQIPKGYFWIFPSANGHANVGIGGDKEQLVKHKISLQKTFLDIINKAPQFKARFANAELVGAIKGWSIPIGYFGSRLPISGERALLCGDAAALADPATGEGIGQAMSSGRYAAWTAKECFAKNNFSAAFMKSYDRQIKKKYAKEYARNSKLASISYQFPWLIDFICYASTKLRTKDG